MDVWQRKKLRVSVLITAFFSLALLLVPSIARSSPASAFRPPAVPLLTYDPYLNIWADCTHIANHSTRAWTGQKLSLVSLIRVDGKTYRLMGGEPKNVSALTQTSLKVLPLESIYQFAGHGVAVRMSFLTPRLPGDLAAFGRPVNYIRWTVRSTDGRSHHVELYYSTSSRLAVKQRSEKVVGRMQQFGPLVAMKIGTVHQTVLGNTTPLINWGYIYTAADASRADAALITNARGISQFIKTGLISRHGQSLPPCRVSNGQPVEALVYHLGAVGASPKARWAMAALDERYSVVLNGSWLRPYWMHSSPTVSALLETSARKYPGLREKCHQFDTRVWRSCAKVGGRRYAQICALAYRQSIGMMGMAEDFNGKPLLFTDENTSGGDISTVDVIFPACPQNLLFNPGLLKAMLVPVFEFASPKYWPQPYSLHDLGAYPFANGHLHGGGELMPVEESGNMILMTTAIAEIEGNANFAKTYWSELTAWVKYLRRGGFDPGKQLSTNDFLGPIAHNANLSIKAILAMGAYGKLCQMRGMKAQALAYQKLARRWARKWMKIDWNGNHYQMTFTDRHSWSMLYNLAWDQVLRLHIFPRAVRQKQMAFYMTKLQPYGLPDRSTVNQTKTDFEVWTASLATQPDQFHAIIDRIYKFMDQSPRRVGMADQYGTTKPWTGMYARPVVGAVFLPMLLHRKVWQYWAERGQPVSGHWAPLPPPPEFKAIVPTAIRRPIIWRYTLNMPPAGWTKPQFDDRTWKKGPAGFGTQDPGVTPRTPWTTDNIWLRRKFFLPQTSLKNLVLYCYHDNGVKIYINGVLANQTHGYTVNYEPLPIRPAALHALRLGHMNVFAVHQHQVTGGQFFDLGISRLMRGGRLRK